MKKSCIILLALVTVLAFSALANAEKTSVVSLKLGVNSTGVEIENISPDGKNFFLSGVTYDRYEHGAYNYGYYTTLVGLRKHTNLNTNHVYYGAGVGISGIDPLVDVHGGYEMYLPQLPEGFTVRGEGGISLILDITGDVGLEQVVHFGVGISYALGFDVFNYISF